MKRRTIVELAIVLTLLLVAGTVWVWLASRQLEAIAPPSTNVHFSTFAEQMPPPKRLAIIDDPDGTIRIVWVGEVASLTLPSGPSCYVFDSSGTLVRWNRSTGDGEDTTSDKRDAYDAQPATINDVKAATGA